MAAVLFLETDMLPFTEEAYRTHAAGELRACHEGQQVLLSGWIHSLRQFKRQTFAELREHSGLVQLLLTPEQAACLSEEACVRVQGTVKSRVRPHPNPTQYPTGDIEVLVERVQMLGASSALPFARHESPGEEQQLRYRTLSLRQQKVQSNLRARARIVSSMRAVAEEGGFLEVETPVLVRNTPGGATPFLVRTSPEQGYALAQSPQVWKQLLVCGGVERYYQLAHCFRNEGARPERQPEFSQFEIEMAFATAPVVQQVMEKMVQAAGRAVNVSLPSKFPRMGYLEAMANHGTDKPHLGNPLRLISKAAEPTTRFQHGCVFLPLPHRPSETQARQWVELARQSMPEGSLEFHGKVLIAHGPLESAQSALGSVLATAGQTWELIQPGIHPVWVERFPLFEQGPQGEWKSAHHPFTRPMGVLPPGWQTEPGALMAEAFDLAINGQEVGGGSIRIHEPLLQRQVFEVLGWPASEYENHFRPLLEAFALGAPPHGGMALGVERLVAALLGEPNIRSVMAFPKTVGGQCLLTLALGPL